MDMRKLRVPAQRRSSEVALDLVAEMASAFDGGFEESRTVFRGIISLKAKTEAEQIYELYPRKVGKIEALKKINIALRDHSFEFLKTRVALFANSPAGQRGHYTPYPATWFHQGRYLDDAKEWEHVSRGELQDLQNTREANVGVYRPL